jgi:hypothetical protein
MMLQLTPANFQEAMLRKSANRYPARLSAGQSNPACTNNVTHRKDGSRSDHRAVPISTPCNPNPPIVTISNFGRNLKAFFCPRLKVCVLKFGKLAPLKLPAVLERRWPRFVAV